MDAVKYLEEKKRMCKSLKRDCSKCAFGGANLGCRTFQWEHPEEAVDYVKTWSDEHPIFTNADKFMETFGIYASEMWSMPEKDFLEWLNAEYKGVNHVKSV